MARILGPNAALYADVVLRAPNGSSSGSSSVPQPPPRVTPPSEPVELSAAFLLL